MDMKHGLSPKQKNTMRNAQLLLVEKLSIHGWTRGTPKEGAAGLQYPPPQTPQNQNLKNTDFVDIMILQVLCDFSFSRNQPLKLADN
jgi:hypothetical protein